VGGSNDTMLVKTVISFQHRSGAEDFKEGAEPNEAKRLLSLLVQKEQPRQN
jgi:hypothetical protein